jgi:hypothetical protein
MTRLNFNTRFKGRVQNWARHGRPAGVMIHFAAGTMGGDVENIVGILGESEEGLGYGALVSDAIIYELVDDPVKRWTRHARMYNTSHIGIAVAYPGPALYEVDGWVEGVHRKLKRPAWFPPYSEADMVALAEYVARLQKADTGLALIRHEDVNATKNDPGVAFDWPRFKQMVAAARARLG